VAAAGTTTFNVLSHFVKSALDKSQPGAYVALQNINQTPESQAKQDANLASNMQRLVGFVDVEKLGLSEADLKAIADGDTKILKDKKIPDADIVAAKIQSGEIVDGKFGPKSKAAWDRYIKDPKTQVLAIELGKKQTVGPAMGPAAVTPAAVIPPATSAIAAPITVTADATAPLDAARIATAKRMSELTGVSVRDNRNGTFYVSVPTGVDPQTYYDGFTAQLKADGATNTGTGAKQKIDALWKGQTGGSTFLIGEDVLNQPGVMANIERDQARFKALAAPAAAPTAVAAAAPPADPAGRRFIPVRQISATQDGKNDEVAFLQDKDHKLQGIVIRYANGATATLTKQPDGKIRIEGNPMPATAEMKENIATSAAIAVTNQPYQQHGAAPGTDPTAFHKESGAFANALIKQYIHKTPANQQTVNWIRGAANDAYVAVPPLAGPVNPVAGNGNTVPPDSKITATKASAPVGTTGAATKPYDKLSDVEKANIFGQLAQNLPKMNADLNRMTADSQKMAPGENRATIQKGFQNNIFPGQLYTLISLIKKVRTSYGEQALQGAPFDENGGAGTILANAIIPDRDKFNAAPHELRDAFDSIAHTIYDSGQLHNYAADAPATKVGNATIVAVNTPQTKVKSGGFTP
jgi:hypothetical protein